MTAQEERIAELEEVLARIVGLLSSRKDRTTLARLLAQRALPQVMVPSEAEMLVYAPDAENDL